MPGKGRPFQKGHPGGPGRPKLAYLEAMRGLAPDAVEVLKQALRAKDRRERLHAAESVLNRAYGKPKETVQVESDQPTMLVVPDSVYHAQQKMREKTKPDGDKT